MKCLYTHRTLSADGQHVHIRALTDALRGCGHEIVVAGPEKAPGARGLKTRLPAALYECIEYGYSLPAYIRLERLAGAFRPDILYERYNLFYHAGAWLRRRSGLPMMLEVNAPLAQERAAHGDLALKGFARRSEASIWKTADIVLPVTQALARHVRAAGVPDERIQVIHNGAGADFLKAPDGAAVRARYGLEDKIVLGFSGFVRDWHKVDRALRFIAAQARDDLRLLVVGDGPARPGLQQLADDLGAAEKATFTGVVEQSAVPAHVAAFDIALQPAVVSYASPLKIFEYMALGRAIIAPDAPNIREILRDGKEAVLFAADEPGDFDRALLTLIYNGDMRVRLGAAARARLISEDYTWVGNARRVEAIAERLIGDCHDHSYRD